MFAAVLVVIPHHRLIDGWETCSCSSRTPSSLCASVSRGVYPATECNKHTHAARGRELLLMFDLCVREGGGRVAVKSRQRWRLQAAMRRLSGDQAASHIYWDYWRAQNLQTQADPMPSPSNTDVLWEIGTLRGVYVCVCDVCQHQTTWKKNGHSPKYVISYLNP